MPLDPGTLSLVATAKGSTKILPDLLLERVLDHIDYGIACVDASGQLLHANRAARVSWHRIHHECEALRSAIRAASTRGTRRLVEAGCPGWRFTVAVIPLGEAQDGAVPVLLVLGRGSVCERLSSYWYGVTRGLTAAEQGVLEGIADGCSPKDIAERQSVSLSTVRSHIASLRGKTGNDTVYALLREMAQLPPMLCATTDVTPLANANLTLPVRARRA